MTRGLIWSPNKLSQWNTEPSATFQVRVRSFTYWNQWGYEIFSINGLPKWKWSPCYSSTSYKQDMVDVLPSSIWYLMWWASTPFAIGCAWSHSAQEKKKRKKTWICPDSWGPESFPVTLTISRRHWSLQKNTIGSLFLECGYSFL